MKKKRTKNRTKGVLESVEYDLIRYLKANDLKSTIDGQPLTNMTKVLLTEAVKAELTDLYDGSWASLRELSMLFKIDTNHLAYFFDYHGCRKRHIKSSRKWIDAHPELVKISHKKAMKKWRLKIKKRNEEQKRNVLFVDSHLKK